MALTETNPTRSLLHERHISFFVTHFFIFVLASIKSVVKVKEQISLRPTALFESKNESVISPKPATTNFKVTNDN